MIENIFDEIIQEAEIGEIKVDDFVYNISFHTNYLNKNTVFADNRLILRIRNKENLLNLLKQYIVNLNINTPVEIKRSLALLWANATWSDFESPEVFIKKNIDFLNNQVLEDKIIGPIESLLHSQIMIEISSYTQETPFCFKSFITNDNESYELPLISYGVSNGICYIYAIQNKTPEKNTTYEKKIKRLLYKLNDGVCDEETEEYKLYKKGLSSYYPENISDVSPSSILCLTIFLNELYQKGIEKIKIVPFLPIRYQAKEVALKKKAYYYTKQEDARQKILEEFQKEQLRIQNNLTQKFIRNFFRLNYHFSNIELYSLPFEIDEYLNINLHEFDKTQNPILNEIITSNLKCKK